MAYVLEGKCIVFIGGTSGIGHSAALACSAEGAKVVVAGLPGTGSGLPAEILRIEGDASTESLADDAIALCRKSFGNLHALYHVAGGSGRKWGDGPLHEMTLEAWQSTLNLNLTSVMLSNRAAIRCFLEQGTGGSILNLGSVLATSPEPQHFQTHAYAAAKSAIIGLSRSLASSYASQRIRVNVLMPGLTDTPMASRAKSNPVIQDFIRHKQPLDGGRMSVPSDLDAAAVYFLSDQSAFVTGQVLAVDGGWSVSGSVTSNE